MSPRLLFPFLRCSLNNVLIRHISHAFIQAAEEEALNTACSEVKGKVVRNWWGETETGCEHNRNE